LKSLMLLWKKVAEESATRCCTSATKDIKYVLGRFEHEGFSFMTIILPTFGKDFEKSLEQGQVDRNLFQGFPWQAGLPRFLGGFLDRVFDRVSGVLLDSPDIDAILAVRQLTLMYNKISLPCSDARTRKAMAGYIQCEQEVRDADARISEEQWSDFRRISAMLYARAFTIVDREIYEGRLVPKHGPGATADKLRGNAKYLQSTWPSRLERYFPMGEYLIPNYRYYDNLESISLLEPGSEIPVKVISVPKTLKTPRIIGIEPTAMQYSQQAIADTLLSSFKEVDYLRMMLGFDDQTPNQRMASEGSHKGNLATLDLSEASDRVSNQHVRNLLRNHPNLHGAVDASRSRKADVPGYGIKRLAKFASMGSALCFPMEAMVFLTIIFLGIERELSTSLSFSAINSLKRQVRVYGDDIIVPVRYVRTVVRELESFGIRVNTSKSFWNGKFRESCGKEYYDGQDVSIVRVRQMFPTQRSHATGVISTVSLRNQLYQAGYWQTCRWLDEEIKKVIKYFPVVLPTSPVLGRHSFLGYETQRMDEDLHSPLVKGYQIRATPPRDVLGEEGALLKCLLMMERRERAANRELFSGVPLANAWADSITAVDSSKLFNSPSRLLPTSGEDHLKHAGRPRVVNIKLGWGSAV
jgi:hypothetical protein